MRLRPLLLLLLAVPACQSLLGADDFRFDAEPIVAAGGGGGAGGEGVGGSGGEAPPPECALPADCPGTETTCAFRTCDEGRCGLAEADAGTTCTEGGGRLCNGDGACVACLDELDCGDASLACVKQECVSTSCNNAIKEEDEVDVDCGGPCPPCADGDACAVPEDCVSGFCSAGDTCEACTDSADCESDHWCDAGICVPTLAMGEVCDGADACQSGFCVDGVCCESACDGQCESCAAHKTNAAYGECAPAPAGTDPDNECPTLTACNGNRSCGLFE